MTRLHTLLPQVWTGRGLLACLFWPVSRLYGALVGLRKTAYRRAWLNSGHPGAFVIVVGNVIVGGAGKTPTTIALVQHLSQLGLRVGVVSRGHGRQHRDIRAVATGSTAAEVGDEPLLIWRHTGVPVQVGAARLEAAKALLEAHPDIQVIVCDDGLQHLALQRDLEICLMDDRGTGNGWLLPAGMLRQPWPAPVWGGGPLLMLQTGLPAGARPDPALAAGAPAFAATRRLADQAYDAHGRRLALLRWVQSPAHRHGEQGKAEVAPAPVSATLRCAALAGIAQPEAFFALLRQRGLALQHTLALPDHADGATLLQALAPYPSDLDWLCTEKDAVKLFAALRQPGAPAHRVWAVALEQEPDCGFYAAIDQALGRVAAPSP